MTCVFDEEVRGHCGFCEGCDWIWVFHCLRFLVLELLCWVYDDVLLEFHQPTEATRRAFFLFAIFLILHIYIYIYIAEFPYTIFEHLGACFTNLLNTENILNMNIEDNCADTLTKLIKEKGIPSVLEVSTFIIPYSAYYNCDLVPVFLYIIFNIKFIIWYGLLEMLTNYTISISYINRSEEHTSELQSPC